MEDYEKFVELRLSQLKMTEDAVEDKPKVPSLICFHGRPILPPLVSEAQKKEITRLKEAAQKAAANRNHKDDPRMSYVQTILQSVDIRKTPTLEELLKESEIDNQPSSGDCINGLLSQSPCANESLSFPFTPTEMVVESVHPLTSTTCCSPVTLHLPLSRHNFPQAGDPGLDSCSFKADSHQIYSGDDVYTNDNAVSAKCSHRNDVELFSDHNSSATLKEVPYIINYPPVDGEELERSGHEASFGVYLKAENPESISFINVPSAEDSQSEKNKHKENSQLPSVNDEELKVANDLTHLPTVTQLPNSLKEKHTPLSETMQTDDTDSKPSEEPYRMSLQALLKKSQECRQRQLMLRSQGKSAKIQDRAQDQPKSEEQSLSDKENDEHHTKGTEPRNSQERSYSHSSIVDQSLKRSYESDRRSDNIYDKPPLTIDNHAQDCVLDHSESSNFIKMNNWVNRGEQRNVSSQAPIWTEDVCKSNESSANTSPTALANVKKYHDIPALNFCKSPVPCKVKSPSAPFDNTSQKSVVINMSMNNNKVREDNTSTSPVNVVGSDVTSVLAKSSQHIDQLEFNLSGLKVLISDLESTLTENVDTRSSQSESQQTSTSQNDSLYSLGDVILAQKSHSPEMFKGNDDKSPLIEIKAKTVPLQQLVKTASGEKDHTSLTHTQNIRRLPSAKSSLSTGQKMRIPGAFRTCLAETTTPKNQSVLSEASDQNGKTDSDVGHDSSCTSLNQSYDVDTPSELWLHRLYEEKHMTPESGGEGQRSKVKRRLQMNEGVLEKEDEQTERRASTAKAAAQWHEGLDGVKERQAQLRQIHAAQIRALQDQHQQQQEQLLQALAVRCSLLQSVSLPCSVSTSRLGDTLTFPTLSQPAALLLPVHYRHLLSAIAKGFLTRRLLKTERVAQLVRTARDTHQFLQAFQKHSPNKGLPSRQDLLLQERVTLQLRAARYEIHDIFFSLTTREKMQLISIDRDRAWERALKQQNAPGGKRRGKGTLSAATQKSLERKSVMYKKSVERHRGAGTRLRHKPGLSAEQSLETRAGQHRANPQRVPKSTYTSRPR